jgi:hypothetical protein
MRVEEIQALVPTWKQGSGIALHMVTPKTHEHFSVSFTDAKGPAQEEANGVKLTVVEALAKEEEGKPLGRFVLLTPKLSPGKFKVTPDNLRFILISVFGDMDINGPNATASTNKGSAVAFVLRQADNGTDLEGMFAGKLVSKNGSLVHQIEAGYIYIKQPAGAADAP